MVLATKLDRSDQWTACEIVRWSEELSQSVGLQAKELAPAFAKLFATKDLRVLYVERVHSLKAQASAASHAAKYLKETSKALEKHVEDPDAPAALARRRQVPRVRQVLLADSRHRPA